jgi:hypothetical protein
MREQLILHGFGQRLELAVEDRVKQNGPSHRSIMHLKTYAVKYMPVSDANGRVARERRRVSEAGR